MSYVQSRHSNPVSSERSQEPSPKRVRIEQAEPPRVFQTDESNKCKNLSEYACAALSLPLQVLNTYVFYCFYYADLIGRPPYNKAPEKLSDFERKIVETYRSYFLPQNCVTEVCEVIASVTKEDYKTIIENLSYQHYEKRFDRFAFVIHCFEFKLSAELAQIPLAEAYENYKNVRAALLKTDPEKCEDLDLELANIVLLPPEIERLTHLKMMTLNRNPLYCLPAGIGQLKTLTELYLNQNVLFVFIREAMEHLSNLRRLDLSQTPSDLSDDLKNTLQSQGCIITL